MFMWAKTWAEIPMEFKSGLKGDSLLYLEFFNEH